MASEYKNTTASIGAGEKASSIPAPRRSLGNIMARGVGGLQAELMTAPPIHRAFLGSAKTGMEADMALASAAEAKLLGQKTPSGGTKIKEMFARGDSAFDTEKSERVTIIKTHVGQTKKGTPIHYVVSREGEGWRQKETKLRRR